MQSETSLPAWGISATESLWPVTIRILFVIDGRITLNKDDIQFGLGYVLDTLRAVWSWWVGFEVDIATREESISSDALGTNSVKYCAFKFTQADFDIDRYDQIWFFADQPNDNDGSDATTDAHILPPYTLVDEELRIIAEWMDHGGGVFATGDHGVLGASLCSRIPRVRTMRRWTRSQGVPSLEGPRRHQTLQGGSDFLGEGDTLLQPVELVYWATANKLPFLPHYRPHAVMCSNWGPIDRFPDHMHEGDLVADELVELDRPLNIPGHDRPEYPYPIPEVLAFGLPSVGEIRWRPRPQIVAFGNTTNRYYPDEFTLDASAGMMAARLLLYTSKRFGLVSVYDGNAANLGRVVCDSTWHHWLSINLVGIAEGDAYAYRKMQAYYRNLGLWLAGQDQRRSMLVSGVWGTLIGSSPMLFTAQQSAWDMGERALSVLEYSMSPCWIDEVVASFLDIRTISSRILSGDLKSSEPRWNALSGELVNRAIVGSLCKSLFDIAFEHRKATRKYDRVRVDVELIRKRAAQGAAHGLELLKGTLDDATKSFGALRDKLAKAEVSGPIQDGRD